MSDRLALQLAYSNPKPGREDDFNSWYDDQHVPDWLAIPGVAAVTRYQLSEWQRPGTETITHRFLTVYELSGDPRKVFAKRDSAASEGHFRWTDALEMTNEQRIAVGLDPDSDSEDRPERSPKVHLWLPITERLKS
jgi:hypothetical protein